jgi:secreted Zn-dependent insulinase-like peptidase
VATSGLRHFVLTGLLCVRLFQSIPSPRTVPNPEPTGNSIPRYRETELLNGLRVIAIEKPGETAVINVLVKSGSHADPRDKAGLAT